MKFPLGLYSNREYSFENLPIRSASGFPVTDKEGELFLNMGLLAIVGEFLKKKILLSSEITYVTSYEIYRQLPQELHKHFAYFVLSDREQIHRKKLIVHLDVFDKLSFGEDWARRLELKLDSLNNYEEKLYFLNFQKLELEERVRGDLCHLLNVLPLKDFIFIDGTFFLQNPDLRNYEALFLEDPFMRVLPDHYESILAQGAGVKGFVPEGKKSSSYLLRPDLKFEVFRDSSEVAWSLEDHVFRKKFLEYYSAGDLYNSYHLLKREINYASKRT